MRISDWRSDLCSSDLVRQPQLAHQVTKLRVLRRIEASRAVAKFLPQFAEQDGGWLAGSVQPGHRRDIAIPCFARLALQIGRAMEGAEDAVRRLYRRRDLFLFAVPGVDRKSTRLNSSH